jgi:hypothetical protein
MYLGKIVAYPKRTHKEIKSRMGGGERDFLEKFFLFLTFPYAFFRRRIFGY